MQYTNKFNIPPEVCRAFTKDRYTNPDEDPCDWSVTSLINPIQLSILKQRYPDKQRIFDVSQMMWSFIGQIAHQVIEEQWVEEEGHRVEERLYAVVHGKTISGKIDCYAHGQIRDYKSTKCYKIMKGDYTEWEKQLNLYAWLCRLHNYPVNKLRIIALLFDWKEHEAYKQDYPKCPIVEIPIPLWTFEEQQTFVSDRLAAILSASNQEDIALPPCSDKEMWCDIRDHAVMKQGGTRAVKVFDNMGEAAKYAAEKGNGYYAIERKTARTRCLKWCSVSNLCHQHRRLLIEEGQLEEE